MNFKLPQLLIAISLLCVYSCQEKNNEPIIINQKFKIDENSKVGTIIGTIVATDPDGDLLKFEFSDTQDIPFNLEINTGVLTVKEEKILDYEFKKEYSFIIKVSDVCKRSLFTIATITIEISNVYEIPLNGLVANFPFDGNPIDQSSTKNNCTVDGCFITQDRFGKSSSAYSFDGINDRMVISHSSSLNFDAGTDSYTINLWINSTNPTNGNPNFGRLFSKWNEENPVLYPYVLLYNSTSCTAMISHGDKYNKSTVNYTNVWDGKWHMITFVVNNAERKIYSYVDGNIIEVAINKATAGTKNDHNIVIGYCWPNAVYYKGLLDDILVYNRALSELEIKSIFSDIK